jgi:hypothetical protein
MTGQEIMVALLGLAALGYVLLRLRRRQGGNCCGESECPAAKEVGKRLTRTRREARG